MKDRYITILDFGNLYCDALICNCKKDKLFVVLSKRYDFDGYCNGKIIDEKAFSNSLNKVIFSLKDNDSIIVSEIILMLPNNSHHPLKLSKTFNVKTAHCIIDQNGIDTMIKSAFTKQLVDGEEVILFVTDSYELDDGTFMSTPPINRSTRELTIHYYLHSISSNVYNNLNDTIRANKIDILGYEFNANLLKYQTNASNNICIDISQDKTIVSYFTKGYLYKSSNYSFGVSSIIKRICDEFDIENKEALDYFEKYFNLSELDYSCLNTNIDMKKLYDIVADSITSFLNKLDNELKNNLQTTYSTYNIIFSGVLLNFINIEKLFSEIFKQKITLNKIDVLGINSQEFNLCYFGLLDYISTNSDYYLNKIDDISVNKEINTDIE